MKQLSPFYRNDDPEGIDEQIKEYLDKNYLQYLKNLDKSNPKLLVVFSGGNAMGKSTISNKIMEKFNAIVLENDEIKRHIHKFRPDLDRVRLNQATWQYSMGLYKRINNITSNGH